MVAWVCRQQLLHCLQRRWLGIRQLPVSSLLCKPNTCSASNSLAYRHPPCAYRAALDGCWAASVGTCSGKPYGTATPKALARCHSPPQAGRQGSLQTADSLYSAPELYDWAFSFRDFDKEVAFLQQVLRTHSQREFQVGLELGCGPAEHAVRLAKQGVAMQAVDCNEAMVHYARSKAEAAGVTLLVAQGDMRSWSLPEGRQADLAWCLLGGFCHMLDNQAALACLARARDSLAPGGLLVLELPHPADLFDGLAAQGDVWEAPERGNRQLVVEFGQEDDLFDPITQVVQKQVRLTQKEGGREVGRLEETVAQRSYTWQELDLLARLAGLALVAGYGDLDTAVGLQHEQAYRLVAVLHKPA